MALGKTWMLEQSLDIVAPGPGSAPPGPAQEVGLEAYQLAADLWNCCCSESCLFHQQMLQLILSLPSSVAVEPK